jgi:hypothetical protein
LRFDRWAFLRAAVILLAIALLAVFAACSSSDKKEKTPETGDTPAAEQSPADGGDGGDGETPTPDGGDDGGDGGGVGAGGDAFDDVPLPDGAEEVNEVTVSGQQFPFFVPTESGVDTEAFGEWTMKEYDVDASVGDVVDFYKDNRGSWDEAYAVTSSDAGLIVWASDDGNRAAWVSFGEGGSAGTTALVIIYGERQ